MDFECLCAGLEGYGSINKCLEVAIALQIRNSSEQLQRTEKWGYSYFLLQSQVVVERKLTIKKRNAIL